MVTKAAPKKEERRGDQTNSRNIGQMERGRRRVNVLIVFAAGLLETVQRRVDEVLGESGVGLALLGHLDALVLRRHGSDLLAVHFQLVQVRHGCPSAKSKTSKFHLS